MRSPRIASKRSELDWHDCLIQLFVAVKARGVLIDFKWVDRTFP